MDTPIVYKELSYTIIETCMEVHRIQDRFPELVAWMYPLMGHDDRENMTRIGKW
jgi:hypothetical protein